MHPYLSQALAAEQIREARKQAASARQAASVRDAKAQARLRTATAVHTVAPLRWLVRGA